MQILQLSQKQFKNTVPDQNTVLIWPELLNDGSIVLHSRTHEGINKPIGTGFGQVINISKQQQINNQILQNQVLPFIRKNDQNELQLSAKLSSGQIITIDGGIEGFGKNINLHKDEQIEVQEGKIVPYFKSNNGYLQLVAKDDQNKVIPISDVNSIFPAICVDVDYNKGTCSVIKVQIQQQQDGSFKTKYVGQKIQNLIYTWDKPYRQDLMLKISGSGVTQPIPNNYYIENEYKFLNQRKWVNTENLDYVIKYDTLNQRWSLFYKQQIISYDISKSDNPYDQTVNWTIDIKCQISKQ